VSEAFRQRILEGQPLCIRGGGSKDFYGGPHVGKVLDTRGHAGIVNYEPTELVVTARSGTLLADLEAELASRQQFLPFEAPDFNGTATIGGAVAAGLSGPRRAAVGALRDFVLGVTIMDGAGRTLKFGGEVMKNVAGYDVSRLLAGSLGTLGVILEVSLKVLPVPLGDASLSLTVSEAEALDLMNRWAAQPLPIVATCWHEGQLWVRLAGATAAVVSAQKVLGGEAKVGADEPTKQQGGRAKDARLAVVNGSTAPAAIWEELRHQGHDFFAGDAPLWRLSLPSTTPALGLGPTLIEWGGSQRWLRGDLDAAKIRDIATRAGGHATLFRGGDKTSGVFAPLSPAVMAIHRRLKAQFDPHGIFNRGRLTPDF
jgi:glycolate oxidase FAD binding subunit